MASKNGGLLLTAADLRSITDWNERVIQDYIEITRNIRNVTKAESVITNQTDINTQAIEDNEEKILKNSLDIADNVRDIEINSTRITQNDTEIEANKTAIASNSASIVTNTTNIMTNAANIATNAANIATNAADIAFLQRRVAGDFRLTTTNGVATPIAATNVPVKLVTGGNDVASELSNVTKPADNRLDINEAVDRDFLITGVVILSKQGGANVDYRVHVYMDGAPLPIPLFLERTVSNPQQVFVVNGSAMGITAGAHFFEMWVENLTNATDPTWESGSMRIEVLK
jgi:hypothetical protein